MLIQRKRAPLTRVGLLVVDPKQRFSPIAVLDWPPANTTIPSPAGNYTANSGTFEC